jgi:hypothetical protein
VACRAILDFDRSLKQFSPHGEENVEDEDAGEGKKDAEEGKKDDTTGGKFRHSSATLIRRPFGIAPQYSA